MHLQVRARPVASPPDVEKLLGRLAREGVNLVAIGGSNLEFGGELAFVPQDGHEDAAFRVLDKFEYPYRVLHVDRDEGLALCEVPHEAGALHACLREVANDNLKRGRIIRDILVGIPDEEERSKNVVPVHIYSEAVRTPVTVDDTGA